MGSSSKSCLVLQAVSSPSGIGGGSNFTKAEYPLKNCAANTVYERTPWGTDRTTKGTKYEPAAQKAFQMQEASIIDLGEDNYVAYR